LSPDGKKLAALNWRGDERKLFLFDVQQKRLNQTTVLCEKTEGQTPIASGRFSVPMAKRWRRTDTAAFCSGT
jgi:hypothetical protein